jgi:hypothetical protein
VNAVYRYLDVWSGFQTQIFWKKAFVWIDIFVETLDVRIAVVGGDAADVSKEPVTLFFKGSTLRKAARCFETLVTTHIVTKRHISEPLNSHRRPNIVALTSPSSTSFYPPYFSSSGV